MKKQFVKKKLILKAMVMVHVHLVDPPSRVSATANLRGTQTPMYVLKNVAKERQRPFQKISLTDLQNRCTRKLKKYFFCWKC